MKKITFILVFLLTLVAGSYAQCIRTSQYPSNTIASNNLGLAQSVSTCNYTSEYAKLSGLIVGSDYLFTCKLTGVDKYITVTDFSDNVIAFGDSPLTVPAISADQVKVHFSNDAGCASTSSCHVTTVQIILTCPVPLSSVVANITTTSADFSWQPGGSETAWEVLVLPSGSAAPTATTTGVAVTNNPQYLATNLVPSSSYQFYVRSNCGGDFSPWTAPLSVASACVAVTSFNENFDAAVAFPTCWARVGTGGSTNVQASTSASSLPNNLYLYGGSATSQGLVAMPPVSNAGAGTHRLKFKARANFTVGGVIEVGYLTDITDPASFVSLQNFTTTSTTVYDVFIAELPADPGYTYEYLAFRHLGAPANSVLIDDVAWEPIPSCPDVNTLTYSGITSSSADIAWIAGGSETSWQYVLGAPTVTDPTTLTPVDLSVANATIGSLTPQTTYKVWVRSNCGSGSYGVWVGPLTFSTACIPMVTLPWTENFDALTAGTNVFPSCWSYTNTLSTWSISTSPVAHSGANSLRRTWSTDGWAFIPVATLTAGTSYTFSYYMRTNDTTIGYDVTVGAGNGQSEADMTETLSSITGYAGVAWTKFTYEFIPTTSGDYSFGIHVVAPVAPNGINFDDLKLEITPSCVEPTLLISSNVASSIATISWTEPTIPAASGYEYYVTTTNTAPTAATVATGSVAVGIATKDLTGLLPATTYYVWVRSVCSATDSSSWSTPTSFMTACLPMTTLPWAENFDALTTGTDLFPSCWSYLNTSSNWFISTDVPGNSGANSLRRSWGTDGWAYTPMATLTAGTSYTFSYYMRTKDTTVGYDLTIAAGNAQSDADMTTTLSTLTAYQGVTWTKFTYEFTPATTGDYSFGIHVVASFAPNGINFDDFKLELTPSCVEPTLLVASSVTSSSASISWAEPTIPAASGYEYYVTTTNTAPTATTVATGSVVAGLATANLANLSPATTYYVWVRGICSTTDVSGWSTFTSFTTACVATTVPYSQDFESATVPALPMCTTIENAGTGNDWTTASNPGYGFATKALRYSYNSSNTANTWFYTQPIALIGGTEYLISYDYGNNSTFYTESLKVAYGTSASAADMTNVIADYPAITGGTTASVASTDLVSFTPTVSGDYYFGFNAYSIANQYYLFVDNIMITPALANDTFDNSNFTYYPNPVKNVLNISYNKNITDVAVFNLLGQQMSTKTVNANQSQIDMSNLAIGTYLVKITADNQVKTIKVIKQ